MSALRWLTAPASLLAETFLPPGCLACHAPLGPREKPSNDSPESLLCRDCRMLLRPLGQERCCPHCGAHPFRSVPGRTPPGKCVDCASLPEAFVEARSAFPYQSPAGGIVRNLKYRRSPFLAEWLVRLSVPHVRDWLYKAADGAVIAFVPMTGGRQVSRGYNQAEEIALALGGLLGRPVLGGTTLVRVAHRGPQARHGTRRERRAALKGVFVVRQPEKVRGKKILLVDDVMTTGATAAFAAAALQTAGAEEIYIYTPVRARLGAGSLGGRTGADNAVLS